MKAGKIDKTFYLRTFGCQMNRHDSERIAGILRSAGWTRISEPASANLVLFNTCSVREHAQERVWGQLHKIRKYKKNNPELKIGVIGCMAEILQEEISLRFPEVDLILGPGKFGSLLEDLECSDNKPIMDLGFDAEGEKSYFGQAPERAGGISAFVTVMRGCDNFCSYCVVPYSRGRERSRSPESVREEIHFLPQPGIKEVILLGQNVNSYQGRDFKGNTVNFAELLCSLKVPGIERIRFVTSHPKDISPDLIETVRELEQVCEDLHFPAQSGSDHILARMNRGYTRQEYLDKVARIKERIPGATIRSDFIVGFPGESEKDFNLTLSLIEEVRFSQIFAFAYSPRPGTKAAKWKDDISDEIKRQRLQQVLSLQEHIALSQNQKLIGTELEVLVEGKNKRRPDRGQGRTRGGRMTFFPWEEGLRGKLIKVEIERVTALSLFGRISR